MSNKSLLTADLKDWVEEFQVGPKFVGHPVNDEWQQFIGVLPSNDLKTFAKFWFSCVSDWKAPDRKDIDILDLSSLVPSMWIEQVDPERNCLVVTLAGTQANWVLGHDPTDKSTADYSVTGYKDSVRNLDQITISLQRPHFTRLPMSFVGKDYVVASFLSLPVMNQKEPEKWYYFTCISRVDNSD